jgi:Ice-binding-like
MNRGVPTMYGSPTSDYLAVRRRAPFRARGKTLGALALLAGLIFSGLFATGAVAAPATVGLGTAGSFSVLAGSTVTNTGPTTMFGDLGLSPGSSVTGAPHVLGATHVDDAVAIEAKNALTTAYNDAKGRPSEGSAGTELAGQTFTTGVYSASSSLLLSSGAVTLDAQGDPNAVFIFRIGSTLTTGSNTTVSLINGAQACNVFWQVGSSATLGTGTHFVGTIMANASITANTAATIHGRLLAREAAVTLEANTITNSTCATGATETATPEETTVLRVAEEATTPGGTTTPAPTSTTVPAPTIAPVAPVAAVAPLASTIAPPASNSTVTRARAAARRARARRIAARKAAARRRARRAATTVHTQARPATPHGHGSFTG